MFCLKPLSESFRRSLGYMRIAQGNTVAQNDVHAIAGSRCWFIPISLTALAICIAFAMNASAAGNQLVRENLSAAVRGFPLIGPLAPTNVLHLAIALPLRNREALE